MKGYLKYSLPLIPSRMSSWIVRISDRYFISSFLGAAYVGLYSPGYTLGSIIVMFASPIGAILAPTVAKLYDEGKTDEVKQYLAHSLRLFLLFAVPSLFGLSVLSRQLLLILSTPEIADEGYAITPLVATSLMLVGICMAPGQILLLCKKTKILGAAWILAAVTNAVLNVIFVPAFGIIGAAITTLIAYTLIAGIITYFAFRDFTFQVDWTFIIKSVVASAVMSLVVWAINPEGVYEVLLTIIAGAAVYFAVLFAIKGFSREEISFFWGLLRRTTPAADSDDKVK